MVNIHRYYLFATENGANWVRQLAYQKWDGKENEFLTCKTPLYSINDPVGQILYYCMSFVCSEEDRLELESLDESNQIPSDIVYTRVDTETGIIQYSNHILGQQNIGKLWDTNSALTQLNLTFYNYLANNL